MQKASAYSPKAMPPLEAIQERSESEVKHKAFWFFWLIPGAGRV
jgi:hypothetical protein